MPTKVKLHRKTEPKIPPSAATTSASLLQWKSCAPFGVAGVIFLLPYLGGLNELRWSGLLCFLIGLLGVVTILVLLWRGGSFSFSLAEALLLLLLGWQVIATLFSVYPWASLMEIARWLTFAVVTFAVRRWSRDRHWGLILATAFALSAFIPALWEIRSYLKTAYADPRWRVFGPFLHPNLFANYLLMALPVAVSLAFEKPLGWSIPFFLTVPILLVCLLLTGSRGALLALFLSIAISTVFLFFRWKAPDRLKALAAAFAPLSLLLLLSLVLLLPPIRERLFYSLSGQAHSWAFRILVWKSSVLALSERLFFGSGPGTFEWVYPRYAQAAFTRHGHNGFLQVGVESGVVALVAVAAFLVLTFMTSVRAGPSHPLPHVSRACGIGVLAFSLHNLTETAWLTSANLLALAVLSAVGRVGEPERFQLRRSVLPFLLFPAVVAVYSGAATVGAWIADNAVRSGSPTGRLRLLAKASAWDPLNAAYHYQKASLLISLARLTGDRTYLSDGVRAIDRAIALQPHRSGNYRIRASILQNLGDWRGAKRDLQKAIEVNPIDTESYWRLAETYRETGEEEKALSIYRRMVKMSRGPLGRYRPLDFWSDPFLTAAKVALAEHFLKTNRQAVAHQLATEALSEMDSFLTAFLPVLKVQDPHVAVFYETLSRDLRDRARVILDRVEKSVKE